MNRSPGTAADYSIILLGGAPRTGTTLVGSLLSWAPETHPLPREAGPLVVVMQERRKLAFSLARFGDGLAAEAVAEDIARFALRRVMDEVYRRHAVPVLVFRGPALSRELAQLRRLVDWTSVETVFCVRDPRDAVVSILDWNARRSDAGNPFLPAPTASEAGRFFMSYNRSLPKTHHYVQYETVVSDPVSIATELGRQTGLNLSAFDATAPWRPGDVDYDAERKSNAAVTGLYGKAPSIERVGVFREVLTPGQVSEVEHVCAGYMKRFGYVCEAERGP